MIDADKLIDNICRYASPEMAWDRLDIVHKINEIPTIEERKGKWIRETKHYKDSEQEFYYYEERCSECGTKRKIGWAEVRYCPNCGAKMEGEENG